MNLEKGMKRKERNKKKKVYVFNIAKQKQSLCA